MRFFNLITVAIVVLFFFASSAYAEPMPGDSCAGYAEADVINSGGPELGGRAFFLICTAGVWQKTTIPFCRGASLGGYCWYVGAPGQSCTRVCSYRGGYNAATNNYAGSAGTQTNCLNVLAALGLNSSYPTTTEGACTFATGCHVNNVSSSRGRCTSPATTAGGAEAGLRRICACNQ